MFIRVHSLFNYWHWKLEWPFSRRRNRFIGRGKSFRVFGGNDFPIKQVDGSVGETREP